MYKRPHHEYSLFCTWYSFAVTSLQYLLQFSPPHHPVWYLVPTTCTWCHTVGRNLAFCFPTCPQFISSCTIVKEKQQRKAADFGMLPMEPSASDLTQSATTGGTAQGAIRDLPSCTASLLGLVLKLPSDYSRFFTQNPC